jgi:hypothetical protein
MVNDGHNPYTKLSKYLQQSLGSSTNTATNIEDIIKRLKARGGREQMLMFLRALLDQEKALLSWLHSIFAMNFV